MKEQITPYPDELLTSWLTRRELQMIPETHLEARASKDRHGRWRHPDVQPSPQWLRSVAQQFGVPLSQLEGQTLAASYPALPLDLIAWYFAPFAMHTEVSMVRPRLAITWCNLCLAEDFAAGRSAHIRRRWVLAASGFCQRHGCPLEETCNVCNSTQWTFMRTPHGPIRLFCAGCWRPLEIVLPALAEANDATKACWRILTTFEAEIHAAISGHTPDQFRFNFTSRNQLVNQVRDISRLLARNYWGYTRSNIPLNAFVAPALNVGRLNREFLQCDAPSPLAVASVSKRRCLLAATCAVLAPDEATSSMLFGSSMVSGLQVFIDTVDPSAIDQCLSQAGRWSPSFKGRIADAQSCKRRRCTAGSRSKLRAIATA